jgi:hypothetical protein
MSGANIRSDDGYTLAEALAALLILGLAMTGLFAGTRLLVQAQGRTSKVIADDRAVASARTAFEASATNASAIKAVLANQFNGGARSFQYPCASTSGCGVSFTDRGEDGVLTVVGADGRRTTFRLPHGRGAYLVYNSTSGGFLGWQVGNNHGLLRSINVVRPAGDGDTPMISARLWIEQSQTCEFDTITRACRPSR